MTEERKAAKYGGKCTVCAGDVGAGAGELVRVADSNGNHAWKLEHRPGECEAASDERAPDEPLWLVYVGAGRTLAGNEAPRGAVRRYGPLPADAVLADWVPGNDVARAIHDAAPKSARRTHDEHRAEILARFGHTEATWNHGKAEVSE